MVRKQYIENGIGRWAMIEKSSGDFISWSLLKYMKEPINHHINFYEVGFRLRQEFLGKGFATEYTKASLKYAFEVLNSQEVYDITHIDNLNSRKVLEKSGLKWLGTFVWQD